MRKGSKVVLSSITAPHGTVYESLRPEFEARSIGRVERECDEADFVGVKFPDVEAPLDVHVSMLSLAPVRR